jgi:hypothetical protein
VRAAARICTSIGAPAGPIDATVSWAMGSRASTGAVASTKPCESSTSSRAHSATTAAAVATAISATAAQASAVRRHE